MTYSGASPLFAASLNLDHFDDVLAAKHSPALAEAAAIHVAFGGFDPALALGQFAAESGYGTKGYATRTRNWGNLLYYPWTAQFGAKPYAPGNGYTYASFPSWLAGVRAYVALERNYQSRGWSTISSMSAHWLGTTEGSSRHTTYLANILAAANAALPTKPEEPPMPDLTDLDMSNPSANTVVLLAQWMRVRKGLDKPWGEFFTTNAATAEAEVVMLTAGIVASGSAYYPVPSISPTSLATARALNFGNKYALTPVFEAALLTGQPTFASSIGVKSESVVG